jgi:hypothetical protein
MFPECSQEWSNVPWTFPELSIVPWMFSLRIFYSKNVPSNVHWSMKDQTFPDRSREFITQTSPEFSHGFNYQMSLECSHRFKCQLLPGFSQYLSNVPWIISCSLNAPMNHQMFPECSHGLSSVHWMFPRIFINFLNVPTNNQMLNALSNVPW